MSVNPINCKNVRRLVLLIRNLLTIKIVHGPETRVALTHLENWRLSLKEQDVSASR
jgi:hypothetical protein